MPWIALYVGVAVLGLVVLAVVTFRLWGQVKAFSREVGAAGQRIAAASDELNQLSPPNRYDPYDVH